MAAAAFAIRLAFGLAVAADLPPASDVPWYRDMGANLAAGDGLSLHPVDPEAFVPDPTRLEVVPTAKHPPAFPALLAFVDALGLRSDGQHRGVLALVAAAGVGLVGLAGRRLVGAREGVVAALLAALHPLWFQHAGFGVSEVLYLVVVPGALLAAARAGARRDLASAAVLGAVLGLAVLTRVESVVLAVAITTPVVVAVGPGRRLRTAAVVAGVAAALVVPWVVRNAATIGAPTVSTNGGVTLAGANCPATYDGPELGGFSLRCALDATAATGLVDPRGLDERALDPRTEARVDRELRSQALEAASDDLGRLPVVVAARVGRGVGVVDLDATAAFDAAEGRHEPTQRVGLGVHLAIAALAVAGAVVLARRRAWLPLALAASGIVAAVVVCAAIYGSTRMRASAEPGLVILAATAIVAGHDRRVRSRPDRATD